MTQKKMRAQYSHDNIKEFIKGRYVSKSFVAVDNFVNKFNTAREKTIDDYTNRLLSDKKSVIYSAPFTRMNDEFLYKPITEMIEFCDMRKGKLILKKSYTPFIDGLYQNPRAVYFQTLESNLPKTINIPNVDSLVFGSYSTMSVNIDKKEVALLAAQNTRLSNRSQISQLYQMAEKSGAYGIYSCNNRDTKKPMWGVVIKPVGFKPKVAGDALTVNNLYLLITPIMKK